MQLFCAGLLTTSNDRPKVCIVKHRHIAYYIKFATEEDI